MLERVEITRLEESTFFAALILRGEEKRIALDARPSDSMALAVRTGAPIYVADDVWESASLVAPDGVDEEEEVERFRDFLDHIEPSDFES
jgi:bifunctional DNase/RNase